MGDEPLPEVMLGGFPVRRTLGVGGMGEVLLVEDARLRRALAAKVLRAPDHVDARRRFELEAQILGYLEHPSIVPIHDLGESDDGTPFYTMKHVVGVTLDELLEDPPPRIELLNIVIKICDALEFAHSRGVVHRDLKPANIMIGEFGEVLVMDWGLAKLLDDGPIDAPAGERPVPDAPYLTHDGAILGTPGFIAPEVVRGTAEVDPIRGDVYALGAVVYELLTGRRAYDGSAGDQLAATLRGELTPPGQVPGARVPWELEAVVLKAMAHDPDARYAHVGQLRADILGYLEGRTLSAPAYRLHQRLGKWVRRHWARLSLALVYVALMVTLLLWGLQSMRRARQFERFRQGAREAAAAARWQDVQTLCGKALGIRRDREVEQLLARSDARLVAQARALVVSQTRARLRRRLAPTVRLIAETRTFFYIPGLDFQDRLAVIGEALDGLARPAVRAPYAGLADYWAQLGLGRAFLGDHRRARLALRRAVELGSADPAVPYQLGRLAVWDLLISERCDDWSVERRRRHLAGALARFAAAERLWAGSQGPAMLFTQGLTAWVAGDLAAAKGVARMGLERFERKLDHENFHLLLALAELWDPARDTPIQVINWVSGLARAAQDTSRRGRNERAIAHLGRALSFRPHDWNLFLIRGACYLQIGQPRQAYRDVDRARRLNPALALAPYQLARCYLALGDREAALEQLGRAVRADPGSVGFLVRRGQVALRLGRAEDAHRDAVRARALGVTPSLRVLEAGLALRAGRLDTALAEADALIAVRPRLPAAVLAAAYLIRARALREAHPKQAQGAYNQAIKRRCEDLADVLLERASVNIRLGHLMFGAQQVRDARRRGADASRCELWLGVVALREGNREAARGAFRRALEAAPQAERAALSRRIEALLR